MGEQNRSEESWYETPRMKSLTVVLSILATVLGIIATGLGIYNVVKSNMAKPEYSIVMNHTYTWKNGDPIFFVTNEGKRDESGSVETRFIMALVSGDNTDIIDSFPVYDLDNSVKKTGKTQDLIQSVVYVGDSNEFSRKNHAYYEFGAEFGEDTYLSKNKKIHDVGAMELLAITRINGHYYVTSDKKSEPLKDGSFAFDEEDNVLQFQEVPHLYSSQNEKNFYERSYEYFVNKYNNE